MPSGTHLAASTRRASNSKLSIALPALNLKSKTSSRSPSKLHIGGSQHGSYTSQWSSESLLSVAIKSIASLQPDVLVTSPLVRLHVVDAVTGLHIRRENYSAPKFIRLALHSSTQPRNSTHIIFWNKLLGYSEN